VAGRQLSYVADLLVKQVRRCLSNTDRFIYSDVIQSLLLRVRKARLNDKLDRNSKNYFIVEGAVLPVLLMHAHILRFNTPRPSGRAHEDWMLVDLGDVIVHLFDDKARARFGPVIEGKPWIEWRSRVSPLVAVYICACFICIFVPKDAHWVRGMSQMAKSSTEWY